MPNYAKELNWKTGTLEQQHETYSPKNAFFAIGAIVLFFLSPVLSMMVSYQFSTSSGWAAGYAAVLMMFMFLGVFWLLGLVIGIVALKRQEKRRTLALSAVVLNGLAVFFYLMFILAAFTGHIR